MHGIIVIDKPAGITSHDVVNRVRKIMQTRRVGHTGTLDPFATGVMTVLVGQATRLAQFLDKDEKEYEAIVQFGSETDTGDRTGMRTVASGHDEKQIADSIALIDWESAFSKFRGEIMQTPPMYSAKKVEGKKLYELARKGVEVERKAVAVTIRELEKMPPDGSPADAVKIRVVCSAGTYIRTLAEDIGRAVGLGAHLLELRRTRSGRFDLAAAMTLDELETAAERETKLISMEAAVEHLPLFRLNADRAAKTLNGLSTRTDADLADKSCVRMIDESDRLIAIGQFDAGEKTVKPKVVFG